MSPRDAGREDEAPAGDRWFQDDEPPPDSVVTVLLIDDMRSQALRFRERLGPYGIRVEWRRNHRDAVELLRDPAAGQRIDLVLIDQAFDSIPDAELLTRSEVDGLACADGWDVQLHQGWFVLARLRQGMREGSIPATPVMILTDDARPRLAVDLGPAACQSKARVLADPHVALRGLLPRMRAGRAGHEDARTSQRLRPAETGVLVELDRPLPIPWSGHLVRGREVGTLCTRRPDRLAVWAPGNGGWARACRLLAMVRSAAPEDCLVLTDTMPELGRVPSDAWVAVLTGNRPGPARRGTAAYACADLRSDRIFRQLLTGRIRQRPGHRPLLDLHLMAATAHGARLLERWAGVIAVLFAGGLDGMMPEALRADLEELAEAARDAEHAITGGFHSLDPEVRDAGDWESGSRRYLPLAARRSAEARAVVGHWLTKTAGWESSPRGEELRETAAVALQWLVDDPWLPAPFLAELLIGRRAA